MAKKRTQRTELKRYLKQSLVSLDVAADYFTRATQPYFDDYPVTEQGYGVVMNALIEIKDLIEKIHEGY